MADTPPQRADDPADPGALAGTDPLPAVVVHEPFPVRWPRFASVALVTSVALHAGAILAVWSRPSAPADSLALRSGRASVTVQMTLPSTAAPEPMSVEFPSLSAETPERQQQQEARPPRRQRAETSPRSPNRDSVRPTPPASELGELGDVESPSSPNWDSFRPPRLSEFQTRNARPRNSPPVPTAPERRRKRPRRALPPPSTSSPQLAAVADPGVERDTPEPLASNRPPVYPSEAVAARAEGTARLRVTVSDAGAVVALEVQRSSGWSVLDQAALSAVATWRFQPQPASVRGGKQSVVIPVVFQLDD